MERLRKIYILRLVDGPDQLQLVEIKIISDSTDKLTASLFVAVDNNNLLYNNNVLYLHTTLIFELQDYYSKNNAIFLPGGLLAALDVSNSCNDSCIFQ